MQTQRLCLARLWGKTANIDGTVDGFFRHVPIRGPFATGDGQ
jgi:hypothetical protein